MKVLEYILNRLSEASTWRGITLLLTALGIALSPEQVAAITTTIPPAWQVGDSRGAWLIDTVAETITSANPQADRSVKNNPLAVNGSLTKVPVATGASLEAYSGFSASNYLEQAYSSTVRAWLKRPPCSSSFAVCTNSPSGS